MDLDSLSMVSFFKKSNIHKIEDGHFLGGIQKNIIKDIQRYLSRKLGQICKFSCCEKQH